MDKEQFLENVRRANPYAEIDDGFITYAGNPDYTVSVCDDHVTVRNYYCERDYYDVDIPYDSEFLAAGKIPECLLMSDFDRLRHQVMTRLGCIGAGNSMANAIRDDLKMMKSGMCDFLEYIFVRSEFLLAFEFVDATVIKDNIAAFGPEIQPGVLLAANVLVIYDGSPELKVPGWRDVAVVGRATPTITGGRIIKCFGESRTTVDTKGYVDLFWGAGASGHARAVTVRDDCGCEFDESTAVIKL